MTYLDTAAAVWLHDGKLELFTARALEQIEADELLISPMLLLELQLLFEIGRLREAPESIAGALQSDFQVSLGELSFAAVIAQARSMTWTRDPFDRIIAGQAAAHRASLITPDRQIREHFPGAVW